MSPVVRIRLLVAGAALAAAAVVVGVVWATADNPQQPRSRCASRPTAYLVPGVESLHAAAVRKALEKPPRAAAQALEPLAEDAPSDPVVAFNYGLVLYCAGYLAEADAAFRTAKSRGRDTWYEIRADSILHPQFFQDGYPIFQVTGSHPDTDLVRGIVEQRKGHQHSAERFYARAARRHPRDDQAHVAAAVGRFDEDDLAAAFSRLGPLVRRFPRSVSVRFHLGLLLAWTGERDQAVVELRRAHALGPQTALGREAGAFLRRLGTNGTNRNPR